ncbi:hypothetical protein [Nonomuraea sp. NPDC002799]
MLGLKHPFPFAYASAGKEVHTVAAPLLTAAALSLAGVVAGATSAFLWSGPTLLLLVTASLLLVACIQLHYHSRQYLYTRADIDDWLATDFATEQHKAYRELCKFQGVDYRNWLKFHSRAVHCFNAGTILLGVGVAAALLPPSAEQQAIWRIVAAGMVLVAVVADAVWTINLYRKRGNLEKDRRRAIGRFYKESPDDI